MIASLSDKFGSNASDEPTIVLEQVTKAYKIYDRPFSFLKEALTGRSYHREKLVLSDISLSIKRGEIVGIIGRNGAGKSTLLKIIAGTLALSRGRIDVNGRIAAILELGTGFNPNYSGRDNVILSALMRGMSEERIREKFDSIVAFAGLEDVIDEPFHTYSSGMQARLAFAAATAVEADVLIIDEALAAGDIRFASKSLRRIHEICQTGVTALFVSHVSYHIMQLCTRAIWIDEGRVRMDGPPLEVTRAYDYEMLDAAARDDLRARQIGNTNGQIGGPHVAAVVPLSQGKQLLVEKDEVSEQPPAAGVGERAPFPDLGWTGELPELEAASEIAERSQASVPEHKLDPVTAEPELGTEIPFPALDLDMERTSRPAAGSRDLDRTTARDLEDVDASDAQRKSRHRFTTGLYRMDEIVFTDRSGRRTTNFRFGEMMRLAVTYRCLAAEVPALSCGLAVAFRRKSDFEPVMYFNTNYPHSDEELARYFEAPYRKYVGRTGKIEAVIEPLQLRAGEYYVSVGILPNDPGPHEFYEFERAYCTVAVLPNGFDEPSVFYPIVKWKHGPSEPAVEGE